MRTAKLAALLIVALTLGVVVLAARPAQAQCPPGTRWSYQWGRCVGYGPPPPPVWVPPPPPPVWGWGPPPPRRHWGPPPPPPPRWGGWRRGWR